MILRDIGPKVIVSVISAVLTTILLVWLGFRERPQGPLELRSQGIGFGAIDLRLPADMLGFETECLGGSLWKAQLGDDPEDQWPGPLRIISQSRQMTMEIGLVDVAGSDSSESFDRLMALVAEFPGPAPDSFPFDMRNDVQAQGYRFTEQEAGGARYLTLMEADSGVVVAAKALAGKSAWRTWSRELRVAFDSLKWSAGLIRNLLDRECAQS